MKRWCLIPKHAPRPSDAAELLASGCRVVETLFAGMVLIVESEEDLAYTLDPEMWDVSLDEKGASA
jgi:hypothetical protein